MFAAERKDTVGFTPWWRRATPAVPVTSANMRAPRELMSLRTSGLVRVRVILASCSGSNSMLSALAQAEESVVPAVRFNKVNGESSGKVENGDTATGKRVYALAVVKTIRKVRRGFDSERYVANR